MLTKTTKKRIPWDRISLGMIAFFALGIGVFAFVQYVLLRAPADVLLTTFLEQPFWLYLHIIPAIIALVTGPLQFVKSIRQRKPAFHRWLGRIYLVVGIVPGAIGGLVIAQTTEAGFVGRVGISLLAVLWLWTGWNAYRTIRRGQVQEHKAWMIRNYALTFAAVTLRLYLPLGILLLSPGLDTVYNGDFEALFLDAYATTFWLSWVPNLIVAERIIERQRRRTAAPSPVHEISRAQSIYQPAGD